MIKKRVLANSIIDLQPLSVSLEIKTVSCQRIYKQHQNKTDYFTLSK